MGVFPMPRAASSPDPPRIIAPSGGGARKRRWRGRVSGVTPRTFRPVCRQGQDGPEDTAWDYFLGRWPPATLLCRPTMEAPEVPTEHLHEEIHHRAGHAKSPWTMGVALSSALLAG